MEARTHGSARAARAAAAACLALLLLLATLAAINLVPDRALAAGAGGGPPANTSPPTISGTPQTGQTLTCSPGIWTDSPTFAYQWNRDGVAVTGATATTYAVVDADVGKQLTCSVTGTNVDGSNTATSAAVNASAATGAPLPGGSTPGTQTPLPKPSAVIDLPSTKRCASKRNFKIRIRKVAKVAFSSAAVFVNGKRVRLVKGERLTAPVDLRGLPAGRFSARIVVTTVDGRKLTAARKYRTCSPKRGGKRRNRL